MGDSGDSYPSVGLGDGAVGAREMGAMSKEDDEDLARLKLHEYILVGFVIGLFVLALVVFLIDWPSYPA